MIGSSPPEPTGADQRGPDERAQRTSSAGTWIAAAFIALGSLVLVGGVGFVAMRAWQGPSPGTPSGTASAATAAPTAAPAPVAPAPDPEAAAESDSEERALTAPHADAPDPVPLPSSFPLPGLTGSERPAIPATSKRPALGSAQADVTVALFGDLKCPFTQRTLRKARGILERHPGTLRFVFYHRPIDADAEAVLLSRRVALATLRGGPELGWQELERRARLGDATEPEPRLPADPRGEPQAVEARALDALLTEDGELASVLDVRATPTLFVNGLRLVGEPDLALLESALQREERAVRWLRAQGMTPERAYALRSRRNLIAVDAGAPDRNCLPRGDAPALGPPESLVTLVEFSGFECRACRDFEPVLAELSKRYPRAITRVFRGVAPRDERTARRALGFALAAKSEGGDAAFWSLLRALRASALRLDDAALVAAAKQAGLDAERLFAAAGDEKLVRRLNRELELARSLGVQATPTFFVNGRKLPRDTSPEALAAAVAEELAAAKRIQRAGTPPSKFEELLCGTKDGVENPAN